MPVGTSGCTYLFTFLVGESSTWQIPTAGGTYFYKMRVGQLSLCSQVLHLAFDVPHGPVGACSAQNLSQDRGVWRALTTTDVGNVTRGPASVFTKAMPSNPFLLNAHFGTNGPSSCS